MTSEAMGMQSAADYIAANGMDTYWDDTEGQTVATLETEDAL